MFEKTLPFSNRVWYHITKPNIRSENVFDIIEEETDYDKYSKYHTGNEKKKANRKLSKTMAVILGLIVTVELIIAGGMIFNIDFHSTDMIALFMGFMVLYAGVVALLTDN